mgnify:CR=1 FL=1
MRYYKNFELTEFNSFRLNSIAKEIWFPQSIDDLKYILKDLKDKNFFILAGGTNVILKPEIDRIYINPIFRSNICQPPLS